MVKLITLENLKTFLDKLMTELNEKYGTMFYTKKEVDEKITAVSNDSKIDTSHFAVVKDGHLKFGDIEMWVG